jgi:hypothetical protein
MCATVVKALCYCFQATRELGNIVSRFDSKINHADTLFEVILFSLYVTTATTRNLVNGARTLLAYLQTRGWGQKSADGWRRRLNAISAHKNRLSAEGWQRFEPITFSTLYTISQLVALWGYKLQTRVGRFHLR